MATHLWNPETDDQLCKARNGRGRCHVTLTFSVERFDRDPAACKACRKALDRIRKGRRR